MSEVQLEFVLIHVSATERLRDAAKAEETAADRAAAAAGLSVPAERRLVVRVSGANVRQLRGFSRTLARSGTTAFINSLSTISQQKLFTRSYMAALRGQKSYAESQMRNATRLERCMNAL